MASLQEMSLDESVYQTRQRGTGNTKLGGKATKRGFAFLADEVEEAQLTNGDSVRLPYLDAQGLHHQI